MKPEDIDRLVDLLGGMASYNDKGCIWMNHSPQQIQAEQKGYRAAIDTFIATVGQAVIPPAVLAELQADKVEEDGSGLVLERVSRLLNRPV